MTGQVTTERPSYFHKIGSEPLKFLNIGQMTKIIATQHADREFIVSCDEKIRMTFEESLREVSAHDLDFEFFSPCLQSIFQKTFTFF